MSRDPEGTQGGEKRDGDGVSVRRRYKERGRGCMSECGSKEGEGEMVSAIYGDELIKILIDRK